MNSLAHAAQHIVLERLAAFVDALRKLLGALEHALQRLVEDVMHTRAELAEEGDRVAERFEREDPLVHLREHLALVLCSDRRE